jgi:hypothetical protein
MLNTKVPPNAWVDKKRVIGLGGKERESDRSMQNQNRNPLRNVVTLRSFAAVFGENM